MNSNYSVYLLGYCVNVDVTCVVLVHWLSLVSCRTYNLRLVFSAPHGMQTLSSDENSVCLFVRPSVTRVNCDKTVERSVQIYIICERTFSLVF